MKGELFQIPLASQPFYFMHHVEYVLVGISALRCVSFHAVTMLYSGCGLAMKSYMYITRPSTYCLGMWEGSQRAYADFFFNMVQNSFLRPEAWSLYTPSFCIHAITFHNNTWTLFLKACHSLPFFQKECMTFVFKTQHYFREHTLSFTIKLHHYAHGTHAYLAHISGMVLRS